MRGRDFVEHCGGYRALSTDEMESWINKWAATRWSPGPCTGTSPILLFIWTTTTPITDLLTNLQNVFIIYLLQSLQASMATKHHTNRLSITWTLNHLSILRKYIQQINLVTWSPPYQGQWKHKAIFTITSVPSWKYNSYFGQHLITPLHTVHCSGRTFKKPLYVKDIQTAQYSSTVHLEGRV